MTQGFAAGTWIYQYTRFDKIGRVVRQSLPFYKGASIQWQRTTYDRLGRPIKTINADGSSQSDITYTGLSTTTKTSVYSNTYGSDSNQKTQTTNVLGEVISVSDNQGTITYTYDAVGNLLTTTGVDGAMMTITYNKGRQKLSMDDPDKGKWIYRYNALDELAYQKQPRGDKTTIYRDNLGRTVRKTTQNSANSVVEDNFTTYS